MELIYINSDITEVKRGLIGHGTNCSGYAFASGVAGAVRRKWPEVYKSYTKNGSGKELLGSAHIIRVDKELYVANCYTQERFGNDGAVYASLDAIAQAVEFCYSFFEDEFQNVSLIDEFHFPMIGCGLGGLDWDTKVRPIFESLNKKYNKNTFIHYI